MKERPASPLPPVSLFSLIQPNKPEKPANQIDQFSTPARCRRVPSDPAGARRIAPLGLDAR